MALDWPSSPGNGTVYAPGPPALGSWIWDGQKWNAATGGMTTGFLPITGGLLSGPGNLTVDGNLAVNGGTVTFSNSNQLLVGNRIRVSGDQGSGGYFWITGTNTSPEQGALGLVLNSSQQITQATFRVPTSIYVPGGSDPFSVLTDSNLWCRTMYQNQNKWGVGVDPGGRFAITDESIPAVRLYINRGSNNGAWLDSSLTLTGNYLMYNGATSGAPPFAYADNNNMIWRLGPGAGSFQWYNAGNSNVGLLANDGTLRISNEIQGTGGGNQLRLTSVGIGGTGGYGVIFRNDGSNCWILLTNNNDALGGWNGLRPFQINLSNGTVTLGNSATIIGSTYIGSSGSIYFYDAGNSTIQANQNLNASGNMWAGGGISCNGEVYGSHSIATGGYLWVNGCQSVNNGGWFWSYSSFGSGGDIAASGWLKCGGTGGPGWSNNGGIRTDNTVRSNGILPRWDQDGSSGVSGTAWGQCAAYWFNNPSDIKLKQDIEKPPDGALDAVLALSPVQFRYRRQKEPPPSEEAQDYVDDVLGRDVTDMSDEPLRRGFLAHEVRAVMGEKYGGWREENGIQGLSYSDLTAVLWQAVRELTMRLQAMEKANGSQL